MTDERVLDDVEMGRESGPWEITDDGAAEWAMRQIANARSDTERWAEHYANELAKIRRRNEAVEAFMRTALERYFDTVPHKVTKTLDKYKLPMGELVRKHSKRVWRHDDAALLDWVRENGLVHECVQIKESVSWSAIRSRLAESDDGTVYDVSTGVVCDAVHVEDVPSEFVLKFDSNASNDDEQGE